MGLSDTAALLDVGATVLRDSKLSASRKRRIGGRNLSAGRVWRAHRRHLGHPKRGVCFSENLPPREILDAARPYFGMISSTRSDRIRVDEQAGAAARHPRRVTLEYRIRAAHAAWALVEDRLPPVFDGAGTVQAIEGVIDRARGADHLLRPDSREPGHRRHASVT